MRFLVFFFVLAVLCSPAQDTLRVMQYNLLYHGYNTGQCNAATNNVTSKEGWLRTIAQYARPDVVCVNELASSNISFANGILNNSLNTGAINYFQRTNLYSNSPIANMLYYNSDKLVLHSQEQLLQDLNNNALVRLIDLYRLYYKHPTMLAAGDTVWLTFISAHLKAGDTPADQSERAAATEALMANIEAKGPANYVLTGDMNFKTGAEPGFQNLVNNPNQLIEFMDPPLQVGNWNDNPSYTFLHTQSTHTASGCHSGGGLDDRFDLVMLSQYAMNNTDRVQYVPGSYTVLGQEGNDLNDNLDTLGNTAVPDSVATALWHMSDHLPVLADLLLWGWPDGTVEKSEAPVSVYPNPTAGILQLTVDQRQCRTKVEVADLLGNVILTKIHYAWPITIDISDSRAGLYFLRVTTEGTVKTLKVLKL